MIRRNMDNATNATSTKDQTSDEQKEGLTSWLVLNRIKGFGPKTINGLLEKFESPQHIFDSSVAELKHTGLSSSAIEKIKGAVPEVDEDLAWLEAHPRHHIITMQDPRYPSLLKEITDPPVLLYVNGDPYLLSMPQLAMVGSRSATAGGLEIAREFSRILVDMGLVVTSGLALGVDAAAHEGALASTGRTVAVLGTGPDRIYPASHLKLAGQIVETGAIVTEFIPGAAPRKDHFPRRNRVISGLALGTLVVEAAKQSGSLITARFAMEQGKEVFAVPGSIRNPQAKGCHALIREGAKLVESVEDIIEELGPVFATLYPEKDRNSAEGEMDTHSFCNEQKLIMDSLGFDPVSVNEIVERSGLTASDVSSILLALELEGHVCSQVGGMYLRKK